MHELPLISLAVGGFRIQQGHEIPRSTTVKGGDQLPVVDASIAMAFLTEVAHFVHSLIRGDIPQPGQVVRIKEQGKQPLKVLHMFLLIETGNPLGGIHLNFSPFIIAITQVESHLIGVLELVSDDGTVVDQKVVGDQCSNALLEGIW